MSIPLERRKLPHKIRLTMMEKAEIIRKKSEGWKILALSKEYNLTRNAIYKVLKNEEKIKEFSKTAHSSRVKKIPKLKYKDLEDRLFQWFQAENAAETLCKSLKCKSLEIAEEMGLLDFKPSNGWLQKVKQRFNLRIASSEDHLKEISGSDFEINVKEEILSDLDEDTLITDQCQEEEETDPEEERQKALAHSQYLIAWVERNSTSELTENLQKILDEIFHT